MVLGIEPWAWVMGLTCVGGLMVLLVAIVVALWSIDNGVRALTHNGHSLFPQDKVAADKRHRDEIRRQMQRGPFDAGDRALRASVQFGIPFDADGDFVPDTSDPFDLNIEDDEEDG